MAMCTQKIKNKIFKEPGIPAQYGILDVKNNYKKYQPLGLAAASSINIIDYPN